MKTRRVLALILVLALSMSLLAACSTNSTTAATTAATTKAGTTGATTAGTTKAPAAYVKPVVNVGINADVVDLSPWAANSTGRTYAFNGWFQPLAHNIGGKTYGVLMKEFKLAADSMSVQVTLYDYIKDTAGNPLKASDVVFSFDTCKKIGKIFSNMAFVESAKVISDYVVEFKFKTKPMVYDLETLWESLDCCTQKSYEASADGMATKPVGTGPYMVKNYVSGSIMTLEKNPNYWQTDASKISIREQANVQTINFYIISETAQMTIALESKKIDMSWNVSADDIKLFEKGGAQAANYKVEQVRDNLFLALFTNMDESYAYAKTDATHDAVALRKAIFYAVNTPAMIAGVYNGKGNQCFELNHIGAPGYNPAWDKEDNYYQFNLAKAKEWFAKSGYKAGDLTLRLMCEATEMQTNNAVMIQTFLSQLGIKATINAVQGSLLTTQAQDPKAWDLLLIQTSSSNTVAKSWNANFGAASYKWGGTRNFSMDPKVQELLTSVRTVATYNAASIDAFHKYIVDNALGMGLVNPVLNFVVPVGMKELVLSRKISILPGACTYTAP